ncbi:MAG: hypothetical protein WC004_03140 [Candidatus Absconditabacterales bacterium]
MQKTSHRMISGAFAALGLTLGFTSLWNQNMVNPSNSFIVQSTSSSAVVDEQVIHGVALQDVRCETQYVSTASVPSNVSLRVQVLDEGNPIDLPAGYLFYPQAWLNGSYDYILQINGEGYGIIRNVPAGNYTSSSALVGPSGELISCSPVEFEVSEFENN